MQTIPAVGDVDVAADPTNTERADNARAEIHRLMGELHGVVSRSEQSGRSAVQAALPAAAKLKVVTANVDACNPSRRPGLAAELVALADRQVKSRRDAIERSLAYTAESTMRRLTGDPGEAARPLDDRRS
jgi:hypothetical protein